MTDLINAARNGVNFLGDVPGYQLHSGECTDDMIDTNYHGDDIEDLEALRNSYDKFDLPLIDYARLHNLTTDYVSWNPLNSELIPAPSPDAQSDLEDPKGALNIGLLVSLGALDGNTVHEKLDVDKAAAELLTFPIKLDKCEDGPDECELTRPTLFRDIKIEPAILLGDPDRDVARLVERNTVRISIDGMEMFAEDTIHDPGFISPQRDAEMRIKLEEEADEKLDVDRSAMELLGLVHDEFFTGGLGDLEILPERKTVRSVLENVKAMLIKLRFASRLQKYHP